RGRAVAENRQSDSIPSAWVVPEGGRAASRSGASGGPSSATATLGQRVAMSMLPPLRGDRPRPESSGTDPSICRRGLRNAWNRGKNRRWLEMDGKKGVKQQVRFQADFLLAGGGPWRRRSLKSSVCTAGSPPASATTSRISSIPSA